MSAKIHSIDEVRTEDQVFQAVLWTTWNRMNTPEGTREFQDRERAYKNRFERHEGFRITILNAMGIISVKFSSYPSLSGAWR